MIRVPKHLKISFLNFPKSWSGPPSFTGIGSYLKGSSQDLGGVGRTDDRGINGGSRINVTGDVGTNRIGEKIAVWRDGLGRELGAIEVEGEG